MARCPAGPTRREVAAARRAERQLRQAARRRGSRKHKRARHKGAGHKGKRRPPTAKKRARQRQLHRDRRIVARVRHQREARKACLRKHRHAQRTKNSQPGFRDSARPLTGKQKARVRW